MGDATDIPAEHFTAHQAPALLVERIVMVSDDGGRVRLKAHAGLDVLQLTEACAQAIAVLNGARQRDGGTSAPASGLLVAVKNIHLSRPAMATDLVEIVIVVHHRFGTLHQYHAKALALPSREDLLVGEFTIVITGTQV